MRKILPALLLVFALSGCGLSNFATGAGANVALGGLTIISYSVLGQSPLDYALSQKRGKYCDFRNMKKYGEYCINPQPLFAECAVYCYRTLGVPDCTNMIDPHNNGNQPIVGPQSSCAAIPATAQETTFQILPPPEAARSEPLPLTSADDNLRPDSANPNVDSRNAIDKGEFK
jgi:hypothetical protein